MAALPRHRRPRRGLLPESREDEGSDSGEGRTKECGLKSKLYRPAENALTETDTVGISDLVVYEGDAFPQWRGDLLITYLRGRRLVRIPLDEKGEPGAEDVLLGGGDEFFGRFRDVAVGPDGLVYVLTNPTREEIEPRTGLLVKIEPG